MAKNRPSRRNRHPAAHQSMLEGECTGVIALWALRMVIDLGGFKRGFEADSLFRSHEEILQAMGLGYLYGEELSTDEIWSRMVARQGELERMTPSVGGTLRRNVEQLGDILALTPAERRLLEFVVLMETTGDLSDTADTLGELNTKQATTVLRVPLDLPREEVSAAFDIDGTLNRSWLLRLKPGRVVSLDRKLRSWVGSPMPCFWRSRTPWICSQSCFGPRRTPSYRGRLPPCPRRLRAAESLPRLRRRGRDGPRRVEGLLERVMGNTLEVMGHSRTCADQVPHSLPYRLETLNTDRDPEAPLEGLIKHGSGRLCLYDPPGTGKTAFAHYLAERLDRPLLVKRASDVLSMIRRGPISGRTGEGRCAQRTMQVPEWTR